MPPKEKRTASQTETQAAAAKKAKTGEAAKTDVQPTPVQPLVPPAASAASGSVGVVEWPSEEDAKTTDGFGMLRKVIPFVKAKLPELLFKLNLGKSAATPLHEHEPLDVGLASQQDGYKEEMWRPSNAATCLQNGLYEAGGVVTWLNPLDNSFLDVDSPSFDQILTCEKRFVPQDFDQKQRILFPFAVHCFLPEGSVPDQNSFPKTLFVIAGHAMVAAWWVKMCRAIQASDNDSVQLLWQCGRSVTLTCVSGGDKTYLLQRSLMASEDYQTASELTDTWSHWAAKVNQLLSTFSSKKPAEQEKFLKARDISFRGAQASKALVNGIVAMRRFSAECLEGLKMIDKEFGVAVFNSGYVKLVRLSQIAASLPAEVIEDALLWVLHAAYVALKREQAQPAFFTSKNLDGGKDAGGWFHVTLSKYLLLEHMIHVVETLQVESSKDLLAALQAIRRPLLFHSLYPVDAEEDHGPLLAGASKRWYGLALALYLNEYDESLIKMSKKPGVTEILYDGESSFKDLDLHQEWTAALAELGKVSEIVQVSETGAPKMTVRTLARMSSDPDTDLATQRERRQKERDEIWRQAQALRKKVVNLAFGRTEGDLNALWNKPVAEEVKSFAGELNESHRLWVLSTELLEEKQLTPWSAIGSLTDKGDAKNLLKFIQSNAIKPFDFVLVWDGRSLANRKFLDEELKVVQNASTTTELWISYKGASRVGRRVFGGSVTKEIGYLKSNVARVRLSTKPREDKFVDKSGGDEISTYDTGFVGVDLPVLTSLPRMLEAEKEQILGKNDSGAKPAAWSRAGVPLFWQEAKTESCWEAIIGLTGAKCIIDATAGSGALAKAAMRSNLQYLGICKNKSHMNFLQNVIDMHAIRCLSQSSHPLYQQSLSDLLCEHFHEEVKGQKDSSDPLTPEELLALQGENEVA